MSSQLIELTVSHDVGIITINNPPVNALSPGVPEGIDAAIEKFGNDPAIKAIILIGGGRTFIAGADIKEFGKITSGQRPTGGTLKSMLPSIEQSHKPVIAAIHGTAFGGGLETAMSCHYRVAVPSAQVGQPEVKLGIIPGGGGTQRLPRLAGTIRAVQMCAGGDPISAQEAVAAGIVDRLIEGDLLAGAMQYARELIASGQPARRTCDLPLPAFDSKELAELKASFVRRSRGLMAPAKAIEAVEAASLPFEQGMQREAEIFFECLHSEQSKSLIHVFFGEREVGKIPGMGTDIPLLPIRRAAVIGAGTMGGGIAMNYANAGIPVLLKEASQGMLDRGMNTIRKNYASTVAKGRLSQSQMDQRMDLIQPTLTYDHFEEVDIVVEAAFEGMQLKKQIFGELDKVTRPDAILASNTSTLDIDAIASATNRPQQVIGHHFFSPANIMRLLEIVRGKETSPQVIATSMALAKTLKKVGVLVGNCFGFVGNRMFEPYMREAQLLVEEGASVQEVDSALVNFGMALGPLAVGDLAGLDVGWRIRQETKHLVTPGTRQPLVSDILCEQGRFGQKTGKGWYLYPEGSRTPTADPAVAELIETCATQAGIQRRSISPDEIVQRTVFALINEGAKILDEGIALRAVDIDIIYLYGYGFPAYRGGPMWYADSLGLDAVYQQICQFERQHGSSWAPAPLLKSLAEAGQKFADLPKTE